MRQRVLVVATMTMTLASVGCGTTPSPVVSVPSPNFQARLTDADGAVEGGSTGLIGGRIQGDGCILSILGEVPQGVSWRLAKDECWAEVEVMP